MKIRLTTQKFCRLNGSIFNFSRNSYEHQFAKGSAHRPDKGQYGLSEIFMGLGWEAAGGGFFRSAPAIDLDASCIMFDEAGEVLDAVWFRQLNSRDGSVNHSGDNRTGDGDGDDEVIKVNLSRVPANVKALIFVVNSFTGQTFKDVKEAYCRVVDVRNGAELARITLSEKGEQRSAILASVYRKDGEWKMAAIGELAAGGRTVQDMIPVARKYV